MDRALSWLVAGETARGMDHIIVGLKEIRSRYNEEIWRHYAATTCLQHPITAWIHQCPFTFHSFSRPRGYAGDAELLDFIYGLKTLPASTNRDGKDIYNYCMNTAMPNAVRERKTMITELIDTMAKAADRPINIFSLACGHCREAEHSHALREGLINQWIAFDQDPLSLGVIRAAFRNSPIQPVEGSISSLRLHLQTMTRFDGIYALGLYDYLSDKNAKRLTQMLFSRLQEGGNLIIANFLPDQREIGYMETFMRWHLIYRSLHQIEDLASAIPRTARSLRVRADKRQCIGYLEITRF